MSREGKEKSGEEMRSSYDVCMCTVYMEACYMFRG